MNKNLLFACLALSLTACGTPKKAPDASNNDLGGTKQGQHSGPSFSDADFGSRCYKAQGILSRDGTHCVISTSFSIPDNTNTGILTIDPAFRNGKWLFVSGTSGAVEVVLGSPPNLPFQVIAGANVDAIQNNPGVADNGSGTLALHVLQKAHSSTTVLVSDCYNNQSVTDPSPAMYPVVCDSGLIHHQ